MGTRGYVGIKKDNKIKGFYNHYDSYLDGLGIDLIQQIEKYNFNDLIEKLNNVFENVIMVTEKDIPTNEEIEYCIANNTVDLGVSRQSTSDWYCLLREAQGRLDIYLNGFKYMLDGGDFYKDKVWCEYSYIFDTTNKVLEVHIFEDVYKLDLETVTEDILLALEES